MTGPISVLNEVGYPLDEARLREAARAVLARHEVEADLTIVLTDDAAVADLNRQYRGVDAPTDVLSFSADTPPVMDTNELPYLGDLIIAYPYAAAQADREGHDRMHSFILLVVHGTLHLLGYDHDTTAHRTEMWAAQDAALKILGIPVMIVPDLESDHHASQ
ncbi:MAG: rRNA maturation RNase YbeY [Anaerolineae bacterium]|nr:rRNA maturation RNase YbeY [Anaerolineae bacterium]